VASDAKRPGDAESSLAVEAFLVDLDLSQGRLPGRLQVRLAAGKGFLERGPPRPALWDQVRLDAQARPLAAGTVERAVLFQEGRPRGAERQGIFSAPEYARTRQAARL